MSIIVEEPSYSKTIFGFWTYLMTDCVLFASIFAVYIVLHNNTYSGPNAKELFNLPYALTETLLLLTSSFTCGLARVAAYKNAKKQVMLWFIVVFLLGVSFIAMELNEFTHLVQQGNSWRRSAFLSAFFTLVGTHGLHIVVGLLWLMVLLAQILLRGITCHTFKRLTCFSMFWHFLDVVWIFIFTLVYLNGFL